MPGVVLLDFRIDICFILECNSNRLKSLVSLSGVRVVQNNDVVIHESRSDAPDAVIIHVTPNTVYLILEDWHVAVGSFIPDKLVSVD